MADETSKPRSLSSVIFGAAFLMATSAVGPGFLTQTTVFTKQLLASFGFVILLSVILDIFAQLNIWRVLTVSGNTVTTRSDITSVERGATHRIQTESEMRFINSDCGDVKPRGEPKQR